MMTISISLLIVHFIADFLLQSDWMALNKSKSNIALTAHVAVYTSGFLAFGLKFAAVTFVLHWITDYFTSRATSRLWFIDIDTQPYSELSYCKMFDSVVVYPNRRHWFFVMIGFDQLIHYVTLALTYRWFYGA